MRRNAKGAFVLAAFVWIDFAPAGEAVAGCIFNDASITSKIVERIKASPVLAGTRIDPVQHVAVGLLGDSLFRVKWWACEKRGVDAWLVSVFPALPVTDQDYWKRKIAVLGSIVLDARDMTRLAVGLDHPKPTSGGMLVEATDSSFDRLDVLLRTDGDLTIIRLNASAD